MEDWQSRMMEAMSRLVSVYVGETVTVIDYRDDTEYNGYCETCAYEQAVVVFKYTDADEDAGTFTYRGTFAEFVKELMSN